jgi:hypothetical protein
MLVFLAKVVKLHRESAYFLNICTLAVQIFKKYALSIVQLSPKIAHSTVQVLQELLFVNINFPQNMHSCSAYFEGNCTTRVQKRSNQS